LCPSLLLSGTIALGKLLLFAAELFPYVLLLTVKVAAVWAVETLVVLKP